MNGRLVCEMGIYGAYLGEFGIPVGFVSGEKIAVDQALRALPWARSVIVDKREETYTAGEKSRNYLREGRRRLRDSAAQAVREIKNMRPLITPGPLQFDAEFRTVALADRFNTRKFNQIDRTVSWHAENMIDGFDKLNMLTFYPRNIYPLRRPLSFFNRCFYRIKNYLFQSSSKSGRRRDAIA